jgi:hypothetical protein
VRKVEEWVRTACEAKNEKTTNIFSALDWEIELDLHITGSTTEYERAIGISHGVGGWIAPHVDLRGALDLKAKRYGDLGAAYLIVVADAKGQLLGARSIQDALKEALFGDEIVRLRDGEEPQLDLKNNGFWRNRTGARNTQVSGVMLFPDADIWGLRSEALQPTLAINPWADHPLPDVIQGLWGFHVENERWVAKGGRMICDVLGLPNPWPR